MKELLLRHKIKVFIMIILTVFASGTNIYAGYSLAYLYEVASSKNIKEAILISAFILFCWILSVITAYLSSVYNSRLTQIFNNDLRQSMLNKIISLNIEEYAEKEPGEYASWLVNDINQIEKNSIVPFFNLTSAFTTLIFAFIALLTIHPLIVGLTIVSSIVLTVVPKVFKKSINTSTDKLSLINENFTQKVYDLISGYEIFYIFNRRETLISNLSKIYTSLEIEKFQFNKKNSQMTMFSNIIFRIFEMSITIVTAVLASFSLVSIGMIFSISNIVNRFFNAINRFLANIVLINSSKLIFDKFEHVTNEEQRKKLSGLTQSVTLSDFSIQYGNKVIFDKMNFEFKVGGKYVILGESGSGKTSIARAIAGINSNYRGSINFDGCNLKEYENMSILEHISYINQNVYIFNDTIRFNLTLGQNFTDEELLCVLSKVNLSSFISSQTNGLDTILGDHGKNISGGQKQRLIIARALLQNKTFFIVDEGTSSLDHKNATIITNFLLNNPVYTLILITHNLPENIYEKFNKVYHL